MSDERKVIISLREYEKLKKNESEIVSSLSEKVAELVAVSESICVINIKARYTRWGDKFPNSVTYHIKKDDIPEELALVKSLIDHSKRSSVEMSELRLKLDAAKESCDQSKKRITSLTTTLWYKIGKFFGMVR